MNYKVRLLQNINPTAIVLEGDYFNDALIGVLERHGQNPIAVYSKRKVIEILIEKGMETDKAYDFFENTILQATMGSGDPAFISMFDEIVNISDIDLVKEENHLKNPKIKE